jgi:hypothetical protein
MDGDEIDAAQRVPAPHPQPGMAQEQAPGGGSEVAQRGNYAPHNDHTSRPAPRARKIQVLRLFHAVPLATASTAGASAG